MAHKHQQDFCETIKRRFPLYFKESRVLDIGSLDINGNNRYLFQDCDYIGLDVIEGKNVDVVCIAHEYQQPNESFDTIISTNALEHDMYYQYTLKKIVDLLKPGGLLLFSAANSWKEHGTLNTSPTQSATSQMAGGWASYYKNISPEDVKSSIDLEDIFFQYELKVNAKDLQFWGIKKKG